MHNTTTNGDTTRTSHTHKRESMEKVVAQLKNEKRDVVRQIMEHLQLLQETEREHAAALQHDQKVFHSVAVVFVAHELGAVRCSLAPSWTSPVTFLSSLSSFLSSVSVFVRVCTDCLRWNDSISRFYFFEL